MPQFARPNADSSIGNYEDDSAGTTDIFEAIDESSPSDTDYITSELNPDDSPYVCSLSTVVDPLSSSGHIIRYRYRKNAAGGATIGLVVQLREGYTNEGSPGTLIAEETHADIGSDWTDGSFTLSSMEADSITDYSDLYLRFVSDQS